MFGMNAILNRNIAENTICPKSGDFFSSLLSRSFFAFIAVQPVPTDTQNAWK